MYADADTSPTKEIDQNYHCLKNSITAPGNAKTISRENQLSHGNNIC